MTQKKAPPVSADELRREREESRKRKERVTDPAIERVREAAARNRRTHGHQPGWLDLRPRRRNDE